MEGPTAVVLLVEDNGGHAELVKRTLREHTIPNRIYHVFNGEAALDYLFHRGAYVDPSLSPRPNVILLDLRLPRVDGLEVLSAVKASDELRCIPVVVLTTSDAEKDRRLAYNAYVNSYLVKPMDFEEFTRLMQDFGSYWLNWNRDLSHNDDTL